MKIGVKVKQNHHWAEVKPLGKNANFTSMQKGRLPLTVVRVYVEQKAFDPDAVDAQVYCINTSESALLISTASESFITVDEETGATADDASKLPEFTLKPGEARLIAEIQGWEWDGHVGIELRFRSPNSKEITKASYNFKSSTADYYIEALKLQGRIIEPSA